MPDQPHSPEPWKAECQPPMDGPEIIASDGEVVVAFDPNLGWSISPENAQRIVACVNACEGLETEQLELCGVILDTGEYRA